MYKTGTRANLTGKVTLLRCSVAYFAEVASRSIPKSLKPSPAVSEKALVKAPRSFFDT
jgi:hypothetical protein